MLDFLTDAFAWAQQTLFEQVVQPLVFAWGFGDLLEKAFDGTGWVVVGLLQIAVMLLVFAPLQRLWPVEPMTDRAAVRVDVLYTLIHRLGLFRLFMFFSVENWVELGLSELRVLGLPTLHLDQWWPGVADIAWVSFLIYLVAFDFIKKGVRCNCICPGTVDTPSLQDRINVYEDPAEARKNFIARQPMGRLGTPEEIADLAVYIAGATYTSGQAFAIDGGWTI